MTSGIDLGIPGLEIVEVLDGTRSTVFRATATADGQSVAVRLLDRAKEPILPRRFDRRSRTLLQLSREGAGIVPLLDHGISTKGHGYIVSPFYPIGSLQDQLRHGPVPWHLAAELMAQVTEIAGAVHAENVVLGDIRPASILLEAAGRPVVAAFGMATRRFDDGGPSYIAPEAEPNGPVKIAASDVYSLASVFGALIAGRARTRTESVGHFLDEVAAVAPRRIVDVIEHGLAESPTNRYGGARKLHRAIEAAIEADPEAPASGDDDPVDLDEMLGPLPDRHDGPPEPPPRDGADRADLPVGLEDIVLVSRHHAEPIADDDDGDDALLLPAGLEDIALVRSDSRRAYDATADDDPTLTGLETTNGSGQAEDEGEGADGPILAGGSESADPDDLEPDEEVLDLTGLGDERSRDDDHRSNGGAGDNGADRSPSDDGPSDGGGGPGGDGPDRPVVLTGRSVSTTTPTAMLVRQEASSNDLAEPVEPTAGAPVAVDRSADGSSVGPDLDEFGADLDDRDEPVVVAELDDRPLDADPVIDEGLLDDPEPPQRPVRSGLSLSGSATAAFADDVTEIFGDADQAADGAEDPSSRPDGGATAAMAAGSVAPPFLGEQPPPAEEIPFRGVGPVRARAEPQGWLQRARVALEVAWFRSRRTVSTMAAVLGLLAIVGVVLFFAAREIRSSTKIETEGVPVSSTSTSSPVAGGNAVPYVTDPPQTHTTTTTAPPRRTTRPPTTAATTRAPAAPTTKAPAPPTSARPATSSTTDAPTTKPPPTDDEPTATTTTEPPPSTKPKKQTTTTEPPPPPDEDDPGEASGDQAAVSPQILSAEVVTLREQRASVVYTANQCVATRFSLAGSDGSAKQGRSRGFDPDVFCDTAWRLDFTGRDGLKPETSYVLSIWIKGASGEVASSQLSFTTPD